MLWPLGVGRVHVLAVAVQLLRLSSARGVLERARTYGQCSGWCQWRVGSGCDIQALLLSRLLPAVKCAGAGAIDVFTRAGVVRGNCDHSSRAKLENSRAPSFNDPCNTGVFPLHAVFDPHIRRHTRDTSHYRLARLLSRQRDRFILYGGNRHKPGCPVARINVMGLWVSFRLERGTFFVSCFTFC